MYIMSKTFTPEEIVEMEEVISSFLTETKTTLTPPVDIFKFATELGFDVRAAKLPDKIEGLIIVDEADESGEKFSKFRTSKVIGYNVNFDLIQNKFTIAHELSHYIDEKMSSGKEGTKVVIAAREPYRPGYSNNVDEQRKDYMAAALLIPKDDLLAKISENRNLIDDQFYQRMAEYYRVDIRLVKRRVEEVSLWQANRK